MPLSPGRTSRGAPMETAHRFALLLAAVIGSAALVITVDANAQRAASPEASQPEAAATASDEKLSRRERRRRAAAASAAAEAEAAATVTGAPEISAAALPETRAAASPERERECRNMKITGTRLPKMVCMTPEEWTERDAFEAQAVRDTFRERDETPVPSPE